MKKRDLLTWLDEIYGDAENGEILDAQLRRYTDALEVFKLAYGPGLVHIYRAPGRVNLIGEHTDYNHGFGLPIALDRDIVLLARPRDNGQIVLRSMEPERFDERQFLATPGITRGPTGDWGNYVKGVAQTLSQRFGPRIKGMDALVVGKQPFGVPIGAGLSSSSALTVVGAVALLDINGWNMSSPNLAHLCAEAEWYVGTRGGIMDHFISVMGRRESALFLDCRPDERVTGRFRTEWVPIPTGYSFAVCDSGKRRETAHSRFNVRVAECKIGVELFKQRYPHVTHLRDISPDALNLSAEDIDALACENLPEEATIPNLVQLGVSPQFLDMLVEDHRLPLAQTYKVRSRCRHVISENQRVLESMNALQSGDARQFGAYMQQAHLSMSRDYEASCDELDVLVSLLNDLEGVQGARVTGAGWGGCVVALLENGAESDLVDQVGPRYTRSTGLEMRVFACHATAGAGGLGTAVTV
jgi:galactokinase